MSQELFLLCREKHRQTIDAIQSGSFSTGLGSLSSRNLTNFACFKPISRCPFQELDLCNSFGPKPNCFFILRRIGGHRAVGVKSNRGVNLISFGYRSENGVTVRRELELKFYEILTLSTIFTKCPRKIGSHN